MSPYIAIGIIALIAVGASAVILGTAPDIDAIIQNGDCEAAGKLTDADMSSATANQQIKIAALLGSCMFGGK